MQANTEVCGTPAADGGIAVCFGFPGAFSAASGVRPGNVESASSRLTAVTAEWQTGIHPALRRRPDQQVPQMASRTASCSSVSGLGFSSCLAVTEAVQMGHFTWRPRKRAPSRRRGCRMTGMCGLPCPGWGRHGGKSYRWMNSGTKGMVMSLGAGSVMLVSVWSEETGSAEMACTPAHFVAPSSSKLRLAGTWFSSVW